MTNMEIHEDLTQAELQGEILQGSIGASDLSNHNLSPLYANVMAQEAVGD